MIGHPQSPCYPIDEAADCAYLSVNGPSQRTASFSVIGLNTLAAVGEGHKLKAMSFYYIVIMQIVAKFITLKCYTA